MSQCRRYLSSACPSTVTEHVISRCIPRQWCTGRHAINPIDGRLACQPERSAMAVQTSGQSAECGQACQLDVREQCAALVSDCEQLNTHARMEASTHIRITTGSSCHLPERVALSHRSLVARCASRLLIVASSHTHSHSAFNIVCYRTCLRHAARCAHAALHAHRSWPYQPHRHCRYHLQPDTECRPPSACRCPHRTLYHHWADVVEHRRQCGGSRLAGYVGLSGRPHQRARRGVDGRRPVQPQCAARRRPELGVVHDAAVRGHAVAGRASVHGPVQRRLHRSTAASHPHGQRHFLRCRNQQPIPVRKQYRREPVELRHHS